MQFARNVERSVLAKVQGLFQAPPAGTLGAAWNVYLEDSFMSDTLTPTAPYVFLLATRVRPRESRLPMVIIERAPYVHEWYEVGNVAGHRFTFNLHVFARTRGERSDLAYFLENQMNTIAVYDYSGASPVLLETTAVLDRASVPNTPAPDVGVEGALSNSESVILDFQTKT